MRVVIFGASGGTGTHLVRFAQEAGHEITVLVRTPGKCSECMGANIIQGDARNPDHVQKAIENQEAVLVALGSDSLKVTDLLDVASKNILEAMTLHKVNRIVVLGAAGALHDAQKHQSAARKIFFSLLSNTLLRNPLKDSAVQERRFEASELNYTMVLPPRLLDVPAKGTLRIMSDGLPQGGHTISREDVASYMIRILEDPETYRRATYISN